MNSKKPYLFAILLSIFMLIKLLSCSDQKNVIPQETTTTELSHPAWTNALIQAFRAFNEDQNIETADLLFAAAELMPKKNWEIYFLATTVYAPNGEKDKAFRALNKAIQAGLQEVELLDTYPDIASLKEDPRWTETLMNAKQAKKTYASRIENPELLKELEDMWAKDQAALAQYEASLKSLPDETSDQVYRALFKVVEDQWEINRHKLDSIIDIYGWPGNRLVGTYGAKLAWAVPQHYPDVFYKEKCLALIKQATEKGDLDPNHFAELTDRIARETWQKQTYGASMAKQEPFPIKDASKVDQRRIQLGLLEPIEIYAYYHGIQYQRPTAEVAKSNAQIAYKTAQTYYAKFMASAKQEQVDSANIHIKKALGFHGDISNEQLYQAALALAQLNNTEAKQTSAKILKVLIWRKWEGRANLITENALAPLQDLEVWSSIIDLLKLSQ